MEEKNMTAEVLWGKFLVITQEMLKFIEKKDIDMFLSLLDQRLKLQGKIEKLKDKSYHLTPAGKQVIQQINTLNEKIQVLVQKWVNNSRQQQHIAKAYDNYGINVFARQFNKDY